jgi:hypothetical protein
VYNVKLEGDKSKELEKVVLDTAAFMKTSKDVSSLGLKADCASVLSKIQETLDPLQNEFFLFQKIMYKNNNQHRNQIHFHRLKQVTFFPSIYRLNII